MLDTETPPFTTSPCHLRRPPPGVIERHVVNLILSAPTVKTSDVIRAETEDQIVTPSGPLPAVHH
jgi:hypothetical protein